VRVEPKPIGIAAITNNPYATRSTQFEWQTDPFICIASEEAYLQSLPRFLLKKQFGGLAGNNLPAKIVSTVFKHKNFYNLFIKNSLSFLWRFIIKCIKFILGNTTTRHNQLPSIIWKIYCDANMLLHADNSLIMS